MRAKFYRETADEAYTRRARQVRALIAALREDLELLDKAVRDQLEGELQGHDWGDVGDLAVKADSLIGTVATLRDCEPTDLEPELLGDSPTTTT